MREDVWTSPEARADQVGLVAGAAALALALAAAPLLGRVPLAPLLVTVGMAWGLLALARSLPPGRDGESDGLAVALAPFLAAGVLVRLWQGDPGSSMTVALRETALAEALGVLAGLVLLAVLSRGAPSPVTGTTVLGWSLASAILVGHLARASPVAGGARAILVLTAVIVAAVLLVQWALARRATRPVVRALASPAALTLAGAQLLDGVVSYLAVADPFGLLTNNLSEGVAVSALLISWGGPLFPVVKWALAAGVILALARDGEKEKGLGPVDRAAILLLVAFLGLGPGLFSALRVASL